MTAARELAARHGLRKAAGGWIGRCPACGYKTGLRVAEKAGKALWWCASCQDQAAVTAALLSDAAPASHATPAPSSSADDDRRAAALRLANLALPAQGTPVVPYLAGRCLPWDDALPLRFLPEAKHPCGRRLPAMLALLTDAAGRTCAVHRTFLAPGGAGKADVEPVRMTLGPVRGAAVRLHQPGAWLVVAEGIETALAASVLLRAPAWAAVSAGNMADALALPEMVREVIVAADNDAPGLAAARRAVARFRAEGRTVRLAVPDRSGADFNDLLRERASRGG